MTETRFTLRGLLGIALIGIVGGIVIGLLLGWVVLPTVGSSSVSSLSAPAQNDYIVLVANTFAYDQDLPKAKDRLKQLQDPKIADRVEKLAKSMAARKDDAAANVADLAVALGSSDSSLQVLAETVADSGATAEPTKYAQAEAPATETPEDTATAQPKKKKTATPESQATDEPVDAPIEVPTKAPQVAAATRLPKPTAAPTAAPQAAPAPSPNFTPAYPDMWWDAVKYIPASVAPGQQYWRLKDARYCDWSPNDKDNTCPGFPGGIMDHSIYVMPIDENGECVDTSVTDIYNDGSDHTVTIDQRKDVAYPWNSYPCRKDYEIAMYGEGNDISVPGLPSDKITSLCLCNKTPVDGQGILQGHAHVRYFLVFQRATR